MRPINIGLSEAQRQGVANLLNQNLSDTYLLAIKTKKYHWDVSGPQFRTLHELWDEQYALLSQNIDAYAERVRALGGYPVGTAAGFLEQASLQEHPGTIPSADAMVKQLVQDHEQIIRNLRVHIDSCSQNYRDEGTADFITGIMEQHEEMAWMMRSFLGEDTLPSSSELTDSAHIVMTA